MIERGLFEFDEAPSKPRVIFVDEAQDFTQLQLTCIRNWGKNAEWIILVGDDDQTIFEFTGADPDAFLKPEIGKEFKTVLKRSWRVPCRVLNRAAALIGHVSKRELKEYSPRFRNPDDESEGEAQGEVIDLGETYNHAESLIEQIQPYLKKKMSIMFLASCSYMLEPIKKELRNKAMPFQNRYRRRRRDWNPLHQQTTLTEFFGSGIDAGYWNVPQFIEWAKYLKVGDGTQGLKPKVGKKILTRLKEAVEANEDGLHTCREVLGMALTDTAVKAALNRDVDWYLKNLTKQKSNSLEYPAEIYKKHGMEGIEDEPLITIGTIHSVKGAESDVVVLFPDISYQADLEMARPQGYDSVYRLFYVGMTRAKHVLMLCRPTALMNSKIPRMYIPL